MAKLDVSMTPEETETSLREGQAYDESRGVRITGAVERLGDAAPDEERAWSEKYAGGELPHRWWKERSWFPLVPRSTASWDFRRPARVRARRA